MESTRRFTWELLDKLYYNAPNLPWVIMGNFNSYLFSSDKYGGRISSSSVSSSFAEFLNKFSLIPLPFIDVWSDHSVPIVASGFQSFLNKQHHCVNHLKSWSKKYNSLFKTRISQFNFEIDQLQNKIALTFEEFRKLSHLKSALDALLYKEEVYWRQRARVKWLNGGDRNTKFFHKHASLRRKLNTIKFLKAVDGSIVNTREGIVNVITDYFQTLFSSQGSDVDAASAIFSSLNSGLEESNVNFLNQDFTPDEVKRAVFQISGDKAVGLDGLNAYFYQRNWSVLGSDFTKAILDCLNNGADYAAINSTLIVLIPKKQRAHSLKDFRPISLCTTFYKVISKILANRLKVVLDNIISPNQSAFISGRIIFDNILLANEIVHAINNRKNGKAGWTALKLDMSKAFDRVEWDFLQRLFALLHSSQRQGALKGVAISCTAPSLTHLLFTDDSILFCMATSSSCVALNSALKTYSQASGQMINFDKSSILFSPNTAANVRDMFMHTFQLVDKPFISKYLGLPQCFSRAKYQSVAFLKDKVLSVIQSLHHKWFSKAGKEILVKAVLQAIPSYAMACFQIPTKICKELESIVSRSLVHFNQAMLAKQAWRIFHSPNSLLSLTLKARYFPRTSFLDVVQDIPIAGHMCPDVLIWGRESSGIFSVKSAYHLAVSSRDIPSSSSFLGNKRFWSKLWSSSIPSKVKHCVWRILLNSIPIPSNLYHRHIIPLPFCPLCHAAPETTGSAATLQQTSFISCTTLLQDQPDAALDINLKKHSLGVVVQNDQDQVIADIIAPVIGNVSPEIAEAKALLLALEWANIVNLPVSVMESDCKSLVDKVNSSFCNNSVISDLVSRIRHLLSFSPALALSYVPREFNKMAHNCARVGLGLDSEYVWNGCLPSWLS
uniref:Reverse transcriptase domain-containing protein n=1 Tax=Cannabis sativa TaxID=3483 RepID=A0A803QJ15_CANSA